MTIRLIIGRAGTGKTATCLEAVRQELRQRPAGASLILLVPEQATFQTEYALASTPDSPGFIRAQVLSFRRMAFRVLQEVGGAARAHIDDLGKRMLLRSLLEQQAAQLKVFRHAAGQSGFTETIASTLGELKSYCVGPEELAVTINLLNSTGGAEQLASKLADISLLYNGLEEALADRFIDPDDYLNLLAEHMEHSVAMKGATVWVDGFSGFTPQEYGVLATLADTAAQVNITLCSSIEALTGSTVGSDPFYPIRETYEKLMDMAAQEKIKVERPLILDSIEHRHYSGPIAYLEKEFFNLQATPLAGAAEEVTLVSAANSVAEVEGIAREITSLCRDQGFYYRDIIILLRDLGAYAELIATVFDEHGIPFFIDQKRQVMHHPLVELLRSSLEVVATEWSYNPVFRFLKTDLVPVSREEVDLLENYVLAHGIRGSRWIDGIPWNYHRRMTLEDDLPVTELEAAELENINRIRNQSVAALANFTRAFNKAVNTREQTASLYSLLEELQVPLSLENWSNQAEAAGKLLEAREHIQVWGEIIALLDQVVEAMGDEILKVEQYAAILDAGLEGIRLGLIPPALDQVVVGSLERSRSPAAKVAFVLGVSDGVLPARLTGNGILTEAERDRLRLYGLQLAPGVRQQLFSEQYLVYIALTRARERLYLSCPLADEEGAAIKPSQVLSRIRGLLPEVKELAWPVEPDSTLLDDLEFITNQQRSLTYLATRLREAKVGGQLAPVWRDVYNWFLANKNKDDYARVLSGLFYSNKEEKLPVGVGRSLYGHPLRTSVSGIERFRACPFAHFLNQGLRLRERVEYKLDAPDLGQFFHAALKLFGERVNSKNLTWGQLTNEQCQVLSSEVVDLVAPRLQSEILLSSARSRYLTGKLRRIVQRAAQTLCEHSRRGQFQPVGLELSFGPDGTLPAVTFTLQDGSEMLLTGRIDRIDAVEKNGVVYLKVIDYKSGRVTIDLSDIYHGLKLQLLAYLDVAMTYAQKLLGQEVMPGAIFYFRINDPIIRTKGEVPAEDELEKRLLREMRMTGMVLADQSVIKMMDQQFGPDSDLLPVKIKKDGDFAAHSAVLTREQFELLRAYLKTQLVSAGNDIIDGVVDIAPLRQGTVRSCRYCPFKPVCQFDILIEGNIYRNVTATEQDTIWRKLAQESEEGENV